MEVVVVLVGSEANATAIQAASGPPLPVPVEGMVMVSEALLATATSLIRPITSYKGVFITKTELNAEGYFHRSIEYITRHTINIEHYQ